MGIGNRIKEKRIELNLKQEELAKKIGISTSAIGNYESNISSPKLDILYRLMEFFQCDANYFYQDDMKVTTKKIRSEERRVGKECRL